jgi:hypothetical protein
MRIGAEPGPNKEHTHQTTHVVYDARSGRIVATHHVIGAPMISEQHGRDVLSSAHETSGVPVEYLALLIDPDLPQGEGEVRVDHASKRLVRTGSTPPRRIRP